MEAKFIYPGELVQAYFNSDKVVNYGRGANAILSWVLLAITALLFVFSIAKQDWFLFLLAAIFSFMFAAASRHAGGKMRGIEITDKEIKLLKFLPDLTYNRPLTAISRLQPNPKLDPGVIEILAKNNLAAVKLYFWEWAGKGTSTKIFLPVVIFLPQGEASQLATLFSNVPKPEAELEEIAG
ncbi:MAG: hypothetical protein WC506_05705 [Candidatus Micrarchaeia archaeon]